LSIFRSKGRNPSRNEKEVRSNYFSNSDSGFPSSSSTPSQFKIQKDNFYGSDPEYPDRSDHPDLSDNPDQTDSLDFRLRRLNEKLDSVSEKASAMLRRSRDLVN
jgi:hypothetical protein